MPNLQHCITANLPIFINNRSQFFHYLSSQAHAFVHAQYRSTPAFRRFSHCFLHIAHILKERTIVEPDQHKPSIYAVYRVSDAKLF
jgi:hypothetical protein